MKYTLEYNILTWNICGLKKHKYNYSLLNYLKTFDIIGLVETWNDSKGDFDLLFESHKCFDAVRTKKPYSIRNSGGVSVYIRNDLIEAGSITRICSDLNDSVVLYWKSSIFENVNDIILYVTYVSPEGSSLYNNLLNINGISILEENLSVIKMQYPDCYIYLAGGSKCTHERFHGLYTPGLIKLHIQY